MKKTNAKKISRIHEEKMSTQIEKDYRSSIDSYFNKSIGTNVEKLENFSKYVPRQILTRFLSKYELFKKILNIHGSIIEGGVYLGGGLMTFAQISSILEPVNWQRNIIGFDTFSGFQILSDSDKRTSTSEFMKKGALNVNSYDDLLKCISLFDQNRSIGHLPKVHIVKGDVKQTIPDYLHRNPHTIVSLLYLDFDVYEPTRIALENFVPRMPKGAIIAFDELNAPNWPGETLAVLETIGIRNLRIERFEFDTLISYAVLE